MMKLPPMKCLLIAAGMLLTSCAGDLSSSGEDLDLTDATLFLSPEIASPMRETLIRVLNEELAARTSVQWTVSGQWVDQHPLIVLALSGDHSMSGKPVPFRPGHSMPENRPEGFRILHETEDGNPTVWVIAADGRGLLYGIGRLLRSLRMKEKQVSITRGLDVSAAPAYPIRGHQLGYRNTANSWDAWTVGQYEQYIRDLAVFGSNCIEDIPFQSSPQSVHMKMPHKEMHIRISEICDNYDMDYWIWTPATGDLSDEDVRREELQMHEEFYKTVPRLNAVFFPGGDPGDNHPKYVMPHLREIAGLLHRYHPHAGVWISLQGFDEERVRYFFEYLYDHDPGWLEGLVHGPGSPPVDLERRLLPAKYMHRLYGDITHTVRCQYPVENWDQAYALTLGREPTNPQPYHYAQIFRTEIPFTDGFLSYSDGVHDDVNKVVWSQLGWNPELEPADIAAEYGRYFFGEDAAGEAANGILALERNWDGPLIPNGAVEGTLALWQKLEATHPELSENWRWQQLVMRAYYDAYTRRRLIYESRLEKQANELLGKAREMGADRVMSEAQNILSQAEHSPVAVDLREKISAYCHELFLSIGLQTSVPKYQARGYERGAILDFVDYPLNNRWWLEDEFDKIRAMDNEQEKLARLDLILSWSTPGPGSYYDNVSSVSEGPHVTSRTDDAIDYAWWDEGSSRKRLSTQLFQFTPTLEYERLDPGSDYLIRISGYGEALLRANGIRLKPTKYDKELETFKEFPLPGELIPDGKLTITFDQPDEAHLNWRKYSKVTDVWLLKQ